MDHARMRILLRTLASTFLVILGFSGLFVPNATAQDQANNVDLAIEFTSTIQSPVKINGIFGVSARVFLDVNSSTIPSGEIIRATAKLLDPDGLPVSTWTQTWPGFNADTNGFLDNAPDNPQYLSLIHI